MSLSVRRIVVVAAAAFLVAGAFAVLFHFPLSGPDAVQYNRLGLNLSLGRGFTLDENAPFRPTMFREPGYPSFIAAIYAIFGYHVELVLFFQILMHVATALIIYFLGKDIFGEMAGFWSGMTVAIFPTLANMAGYLLTETFFTLFLCLGTFLYTRALVRGGLLYFIGSGAILGILALTKAVALLLPFVLVAGTLFLMICKKIRLADPVRSILIFILIPCLLAGGWMVRNKMIFGTVSLTLRGGEALWSRAEKTGYSPRDTIAMACYSFSESLGNKFFPQSTGRPERYLFKDFEKAEALRVRYAAQGMSDPQIEEIFKNEAVGKMLEHPFKYLAYTPVEWIKMTAFTYLPVLNESSVSAYFSKISGGPVLLSALKGSIRIMAYPLLALFILGIARHITLWDRWLCVVLAVLYINLVYALLDAIGRYAVPLIPFYCMMAVAAFCRQETLSVYTRKG